MNIKFGFIAKTNIMSIMEGILKSVMGKSTMTVLAEGEPNTDPTPNADPTPQPNNPQPTVNYEDLISKARQEEKAKLYPQIETLKKEKDALVEKNNNNLLTIASKDKEIDTLKATITDLETNATKTDDETIKALKKQVKSLEKTVESYEANQVDVEAITKEVEDRVKEEYEVKLYRLEKLGETTELIPELVTGLTKEDIDNSFELAKQRYNSIKSSVVSNATATIPVVNTQVGRFNNQQVQAKDISSMSAQEWAEHRKTLGLK